MFAADIEKIIPELRGFARMLCGDQVRADDIVQNACLKAWRARASFDAKKGSFKSWMMTITRNEFLQDLRKNKRMESHAPRDLEDWLVTDCQLARQAECSDAIQQVFTLPRNQRDVFILVVAIGYSYEDAAKICSCTVGTVKSRIHRARANLLALSEDGAETPVQSDVPSGLYSIQDLCGYADELVQSAA